MASSAQHHQGDGRPLSLGPVSTGKEQRVVCCGGLVVVMFCGGGGLLAAYDGIDFLATAIIVVARWRPSLLWVS